MFRNPRGTADEGEGTTLPSLGRPPTPPGGPIKTSFTLAVPPTVPAPKMAVKSRSSKAVPLPTIGRQGVTGSAKKVTSTAKAKQSGKGNGNILSFFRKADGQEEDARLFVEDKSRPLVGSHDVENQEPSLELADEMEQSDGRFNEDEGSVKRRRVGSDAVADATERDNEHRTVQAVDVDGANGAANGKTGPFFEESDSEQDDERPEAIIPVDEEPNENGEQTEARDDASAEVTTHEKVVLEPEEARPVRPVLIKEETSYGPDVDEFKDFEGMDDFDEDLFEEGDEYQERRYMEEQARLEEDEDERSNEAQPSDETPQTKQEDVVTPVSMDAPSCPICSINLAGVREQDAGVHVNNCLDGNPSPLPEPEKPPSPPLSIKSESGASASQYKRPVRAPRPGQASPFTFGQSTVNGGSAFNKLMSGHAEDAAWAEAAAAEHASRGKPSYQRTCPFYKILPGLFICVDAFRYGAVQGCQAYFLSHFHSDHYIGLTSTWSHGPIYCSKVTANLVKQQLRVDPKFVVALEFDKEIEVPGTRGVKVTMIPANHCPGSSLYLFEKTVGRKSNGEPRLQRVLHCGDFRACRQHIQHPLLMADVQCKITGKSKEQKIDVCYLDTTYLNPKYAFPSQEYVIKACADMCVSLSKHTVDESDGWEQMKRQRAGEGMARFVRKESLPEIKDEPLDDDDADGMKLERNPNASQQILSSTSEKNNRGRLLVIVGTYSIGKERICLGIARALKSKIYAPPSKQRIVAALEDPELDALMTNDPRAAQVHMTPLFEIRADTLDDYLKDYFPHFTRAVGFRPSGWNYRPPNSRFLESPSVQTVLHGDNWKSPYSMKDLVPQRGSSSRASCFGVPYSEHSSFRELTMFCCALRIEKIIPTVNVGSAKGREKMKAWCERWGQDRRKNGLYRLPEDGGW